MWAILTRVFFLSFFLSFIFVVAVGLNKIYSYIVIISSTNKYREVVAVYTALVPELRFSFLLVIC